jgi:hypothetical protein
MASDAIKKAHDLEKYAKEVEGAKGTDIANHIEAWKKNVNPIMDQLYEKANNTNVIPESERGRVFGLRINLLSQDDAARFLSDAEAESLWIPSLPQSIAIQT